MLQRIFRRAAMKLRAILPADAVIETGSPDLDVRGVAVDSRAVQPGDLFVAIEGGKTDGLKFVDAALAAGAVAIFAQRAPETSLPAGVAFVRSANARRGLALIAAKLFARQPETIAAITGTSGKT